ncbi:MAG: hypothetical protein J7642_07515 [Cyanobacteria bacterium SBC]|nr:hypothetical protein [Cyanobacteria bacterium SBC]
MEIDKNISLQELTHEFLKLREDFNKFQARTSKQHTRTSNQVAYLHAIVAPDPDFSLDYEDYDREYDDLDFD